MSPTNIPPVGRRTVLKGALAAGAGAAVGPALLAGTASADTTLGTGTAPEQVNLTFANDGVHLPSNSIIVSWAQPAATTTGSVTFVAQSVGSLSAPSAVTVAATSKGYTDQANQQQIFTYTALLTGLQPATAYLYSITDGAGGTFAGSFTTAPAGRVPFRFTSYGDIATPLPLAAGLVDQYGHTYTAWGESSDDSYAGVNAVESLNPAPVFHLLNGDLCYADKNPGLMPEVWRDFGFNVQRSASKRPWMPCLGNHENEILNGYASYLSRWNLPDNGQGFAGQFYWFQVGSVLVISLDANDLVYQDGAPYWGGGTTNTTPGPNGTSIGITPSPVSGYNQHYSGTPSAHPTDTNLKAPGTNKQTIWLQSVLATARPGLVPSSPTSPISAIPGIDPTTVDWVVAYMHQIPLSSANGNGSDKGIRELWLPLFDQYQVDLVLSGHDHDYERSFPVRGYTPGQGLTVSGSTPVETLQPTVQSSAITTGQGGVPVVDSTKGTMYFVLGSGGTNAPTAFFSAPQNEISNPALVTTFTQRKSGTTATGTKPLPDAVEPAVWSAVRDVTTTNQYGIALFDVDPGQVAGGQTTLTVTYLHCATQTSKTQTTAESVSYTQTDQVVLTRPRSDVNAAAALPEFATPALAAAGALAVGGAVVAAQRVRSARTEA